jgi:anti-anti-sigma factor
MRQISFLSRHTPYVEPDHLGNVIVTPVGYLDMISAPGLVDAIRQALSHSPRRVVIDLGSVTFLDSCGCAALVRGCREAHSSDVLFSLTGDMALTVRRVLSSTTPPAVFESALPRDADPRSPTWLAGDSEDNDVAPSTPTT